MIKAVVFDMFETLVTLFQGRTYFSENIAADIGVPIERFREAWHSNEMNRSIGIYTMEEGIAKTLAALGVPVSETGRIAEKRKAALSDTFGSIPKESEKLLSELKARGILVGLISNCFSDERDMIRGCSLFSYFDAVKLSFEQGIIKPDPAIFYRMTAELGVEPEECIYVGDGGSKELQAAKEIGMHPVQALWFRCGMFEPHIPSPVYEEFPHAKTQADVLNYL